MHLSGLLKSFGEAHIKLNMLQLSALSVSVCLDQDAGKLKRVTDMFQDKLLFSATEGLELLTVIYFKEDETKKLIEGKTVVMEQFSKKTAQLVMK